MSLFTIKAYAPKSQSFKYETHPRLAFINFKLEGFQMLVGIFIVMLNNNENNNTYSFTMIIDLKYKKQCLCQWMVFLIKSPSFLFGMIPLFLFSCGSRDQQSAARGDAIKDYAVLTIIPQSTTLFTDYPATIEGQQNIEIRPRIDGYVENIYVDEGATVKKGQPLFKISSSKFEQEVRTAKANIKIAQADVSAAEMNVNKVRPLVDKNIISKFELESAEYALQSKKGSLAQANATLVNARTNLSYTNIISPANGVIGTIPYRIGSLVNSNTAEPLTTVSNISNIYAYFSINEKQAFEFAKNVKGSTMEARLASIPPVFLILADGTRFSQKGRIEAASGLINKETGSVRVRATFPNPGNLIRSGSSGSVSIPAKVDSAVLVPQKATYEIQGKKFVYVLSDSGTVKSEEIKIMNNSGGQYFVVQEGLKPGDKIVLEGVGTLSEGLKIHPVEINADSVYRQMLQ